MGKNNLDKAVKDKLYDLNTPIDTSELWSGIQTKMVNENPKTKAAFSFRKYLGLGLIAFLLLGSSYFMYNQFDYNTIEGNMSSAVDKTAVDNININNTSVNIGTENEKALLKESSLLTTELNNSEVLSPSKQQDQNKKELSKSSLSLKTSSSSNLSPNTHSTLDNSEVNYSEKTENEKSNSSRNASSNPSRTNVTSKLLNSTYSSKSNTKSSSSDNIYGSDKNKLTKSSVAGNNLLTGNTEERSQNSLINKLNRLSNRENNGISFGRDAVDICSMRDRIDCYDAWTKDNKFSIVPYVGVDFVTNDRIRTDSFANYLQERENSMRFLEVIKAGLLVKYNVTPNLYVKVGAEYDQIREVFESTNTQAIQEIIPDAIIGYRITMEGDTIPVTGPGEQIKIVTTKWRKYNKYHSFNIPIILGYQAPIGNGWAYFTEAGAFYNVKFSYQGTLLDQDGMVVSGEDYYLNNTGLSLYGAIGVSYNFNTNIAAFATGSYKYNLEPINNADYNPIKQNLGLAGIALGLEFRL